VIRPERSFNEAEAESLGKRGVISVASVIVKCFNEAEAESLGKQRRGDMGQLIYGVTATGEKCDCDICADRRPSRPFQPFDFAPRNLCYGHALEADLTAGHWEWDEEWRLEAAEK